MRVWHQCDLCPFEAKVYVGNYFLCPSCADRQERQNEFWEQYRDKDDDWDRDEADYPLGSKGNEK